MFTGLIEDKGTLVARNREGSDWKLVIKTNLDTSEISFGDSIAINGACLTVEQINGDQLTFHTLQETLDRTSLGQVNVGGVVNMERALKLGDRLDGHIVAGHVDCVSEILGVETSSDDIVVKVALPQEFAGQFIEKGSIAIDGISLTIAKLTEDYFTVHLIPVTWQDTNLAHKTAGDKVNLETDVLGKYIERQLNISNRSSKNNITMDTLSQAGFF